MSNQEILEKAIQKAIDGGWEMRYHGTTLWNVRELSAVVIDSPNLNSVEQLIFNHDFAKALWGAEGQTTEGLRCSAEPGMRRYWQYHLQQMVMADDPIKYLGENL